MNLGERQAYETGRKDGWQEAIVAMASGAKKLLGPETTRALVDALRAGLEPEFRRLAHNPHEGTPDGDPTEPASWAQPPGAVIGSRIGVEAARMPVSLATGMVEAHRTLIPMESAPGVARDEAHRDLVHRALAPCPNCRHQAHLPGPCLNIASDHGCACGAGGEQR